VAYQAPDRVLLCRSGEIQVLDFEGNLLNSVVNTEGLLEEGIVQLPDSRVAVGASSHVRFYDAALNRLPQDDRDVSTAIGVILANAIAWDPDHTRHLVQGQSERFPLFDADHVAAVAPSLQSGGALFTLVGHVHGLGLHTPRMTYTPDDHHVAASHSPLPIEGYPREILLYDDQGTAVEWIDASAMHPEQTVAAVKIAYVPPTGHFVLVSAEEQSKLKFLTRAGVLAREIDLASIGIDAIAAVAYFNPLHPSGGQFLVLDFEGRAVITDFAGNLVEEFDYRAKLGLPYVIGVSAITNGPHAGAFAALEAVTSPRLVVFEIE
jgi:hypothetical protein